MASGSFDMGNIVVSIGGRDVSGELIDVDISDITTQDPRPIVAGGGRVLDHTKQGRANHKAVTIRIAHPSGSEQYMAALSAAQTNTAVAITINAAGVAELPDGALTSFTSDKVVIKKGKTDFKDVTDAREYSLSCIGFRESYKNAADISRV